MIDAIVAFFTPEIIAQIVRAVIGLTIFFLIYFVVKRLIKRFVFKKLKPQTATIIMKVIRYSFFVLVVIYVLEIFNINLSALFGAAGIAGVAIGFASQTSMSNVISGFFVLTDHALKVGDFITVDEISGTVDTITMLSVKVKTSDGRIVRIPNETIINAKLQNVSSHPTRRFDVVVSVSYDTDLRKALEILGTIPAKCPLVLADPQPIVFCTSFGASGIDITLGVWLNNSDLLAVRNQVFVAIKETFDSAGISIPFPQVDVHMVS
jgi:small-conductance mechanosensitive channel